MDDDNIRFGRSGEPQCRQCLKDPPGGNPPLGHPERRKEKVNDFDQWWAEHERAVMAADWHDVQKGFYAIAVATDREPWLLGYKLFQRKTPRTYKTGRTVGRDAQHSLRVMNGDALWHSADKAVADWQRCYASLATAMGGDADFRKLAIAMAALSLEVRAFATNHAS